MFGVVRLSVILLSLLLTLWVLKRKKKVISKRVIILIGVLSFIFYCTICFLPIENALMTFSSAEEAYRYYQSPSTDIALVIDGQNSSLIIEEKNPTTSSQLIVPKDKDGWKIGFGFETKKVFKKMTNDSSITVYRYKNTNDYYVEISFFESGSREITDKYDSEFILLNLSGVGDELFPTYYAYLSKFDPAYSIIIDGEEFSFET